MITLGNETPAHIELVRRHVGNFQQHSRHQVDALHQLQVDVHVERHLTLTLQLFLLRRPLESAL